MPLAKIEGKYWTRGEFIENVGKIMWADPSLDIPTKFDGTTHCCGNSHTPKAQEPGRILSGSQAALGFAAIVCLKCYQKTKPLTDQLKKWDRQTLRVIAGEDFTA